MHAAARRADGPRRGGRVRVRAADLSTVAEVASHAASCELCRLCRDRTQVVVGSGPADAEVLVVSEAPGYHDDRDGGLLTGRGRELFDEVLSLAGLRRSDVYLTSVVKCRPPTGRSPFPDEIEACEGWLFREIALVQPRVVVTLGGLALRLVTGRMQSPVDVHGTLLHAHVQGRDVVVWPLFHPAAALDVPRLADQLRADARGLGRLLRGATALERSGASTDTTGASSGTGTQPTPDAVADDAGPVAAGELAADTQLTLDMG